MKLAGSVAAGFSSQLNGSPLMAKDNLGHLFGDHLASKAGHTIEFPQ